MHFDNILVTTDFSDESLLAMDFVSSQSKREGTKFFLLSVIPDWDVPQTMLKQIPNPESIAEYRTELREKSLEKLREYAKKYFLGQPVSCEALLTVKPTAEEICNYAKNKSCDLIVMASHGRGALGQFVLGSVVKKVIQLATCPVLVIPKGVERL